MVENRSLHVFIIFSSVLMFFKQNTLHFCFVIVNNLFFILRHANSFPFFSELGCKKLSTFKDVQSAAIHFNNDCTSFVATKMQKGFTEPGGFINALAWVKSICSFLHTTVLMAVLSKMKINESKYPKSLVQGSLQKYSNYSNVTGYCSLEEDIFDPFPPPAALASIDPIVGMLGYITQFAADRNWSQFDSSIVNLSLAVISELGEAASLLIWISVNEVNEEMDLPVPQKAKLLHELADIVVYLLHLAQLPDAPYYA